METKKIIQSGYSIILYKILNEVRRDDDGDCDIDCCATFEYEYYDHFLITYMPFDKLDDFDMKGVFYITFYEKYDINLVKEAILEVHEVWKQDVESVLEKSEHKWVVKVKDGILNLKNTLSLCDSENLLMKPLNDTTFMTLFYIPNYFDYIRIAQITPHHLIEKFIKYEKSFYDKLQRNSYRIQDEEGQMERLMESGHSNDYIFDDYGNEHILSTNENIMFSPFELKPYISENMDKIVLVKAYAHMAHKIINQEFDTFSNKDYAIQFIKNENKRNSYFVMLEFAQSFTLEMIMKTIYYINSVIEEDNEYDAEYLLGVVNDFTFMKPIHNKLLFSHIQYYNMGDKEDISLKHIYENEEFILDEELYNEKSDDDNYHRHEFRNYSTFIKDRKNISFY